MLNGYQRMKMFIESFCGSYIEFHQLNSNVIWRKSIQGWKSKKKLLSEENNQAWYSSDLNDQFFSFSVTA